MDPRNQGRSDMSKTGLSGAIARAMIIGGHGAQAQTPIPPSLKDFVTAVSQSDQYEILAARVAAVEGQDPRVRTYAQEMIEDHTRLVEDLRLAAMASGLPPPEPGMSSDQASLLGSLQSVRGPDFDKTYARQQELAHAQAFAVEESFATAGSDPKIRKLDFIVRAEKRRCTNPASTSDRTARAIRSAEGSASRAERGAAAVRRSRDRPRASCPTRPAVHRSEARNVDFLGPEFPTPRERNREQGARSRREQSGL
jgi:putative membrane protein